MLGPRMGPRLLIVTTISLLLLLGPAVNHVSAGTDDMNLTGIIYLSDDTPFANTPWANNTSFAVYIDHQNNWSTAWRYPSWPLWFTTSLGAYSIVLPAAEKELNWSNGDWYRVEINASDILGSADMILNATSHGTGDPGEFTPYGYQNNTIVWSDVDNWQRWDIVIAGVDLAPNAIAFAGWEFPGPYAPGELLGPVTVQTGQSCNVSANVSNLGPSDVATPITLAFYDFSNSLLIGQHFLPVVPGSSTRPEGWRFNTTWTAPLVSGNRYIDVIADYYDNVTEIKEDNNAVRLWIQVTELGIPDYIPVNPQPPSPLVMGVGMVGVLGIQVENNGVGNASIPTMIALYNETTPGSPFNTSTVPPLDSGEVSGPYEATWVAPPAPGTVKVEVAVDYTSILPEDDEMNNVYEWTIDVVVGPITSLLIGQPNYTAITTYVTSATPLDFSVLDQSGMGIRRTMYRIDGATWINYTATGQFALPDEGDHYIEWFSEDYADNVEDIRGTILRVDNTPPTTSIAVGEPKYRGNPAVNWNITSNTSFNLSAVDGGLTPVGKQLIEYRLDSSPVWNVYAQGFNLSTLNDGFHTIEYRAIDFLGNTEATNKLIVNLDNTPPTTTISPNEKNATIGTVFILNASDGNGSGVNHTRYSIDGSNWMNYSGPFTLSTYGHHNITYRSADNLGNVESEKVLWVIIPPLEVITKEEYNYKPLIALIFAIVLLLVGSIIFYKRPLKIVKGNKWLTWMVVVLPFIVAEGLTGIISLQTGALSVPPLFGVGIFVDLAILIIGLVAFIVTYKKLGKK